MRRICRRLRRLRIDFLRNYTSASNSSPSPSFLRLHILNNNTRNSVPTNRSQHSQIKSGPASLSMTLIDVLNAKFHSRSKPK